MEDYLKEGICPDCGSKLTFTWGEQCNNCDDSHNCIFYITDIGEPCYGDMATCEKCGYYENF